MTSTPRNIKPRVILFSALALVCAAVAAGLWYWRANKASIIRSSIEKAVDKKSAGLYKVEYADLHLDELAGILLVSNMTVRYDSTRFENMKSGESVPSVLLNVTIPNLEVTGVKTKKALLDDQIMGRKVHIINPIIEIIYSHAGKDSARTTPSKEVYEQLLGNLDIITVDTVSITGAQLITRDHGKGTLHTKFDDINLTLVDVRVDSTGEADSTRILFSKEISINCGQMTWSAPTKKYNYKLENFSLSSASGEFRAARFNMNPTMGEDQFAKSLPVQDDRFDIDVEDVTLSGIDIRSLLDEVIIAENASVGKASFLIFRDLNRPRDKKNRVGHYPHQVVDDIPVPFLVKRMKIANAYVEYKERTAVTGRKGAVSFHQTRADIHNFTNIKSAIAKNNVLEVDVTTRFMNLSPLKVKWTFYLLHPEGRFNVKGSLGKLDATKLNSVTVPMGPARIKEGMINGLKFDLKGSDLSMNGDVTFLYENLKVSLLEKDDSDPGKLEKARTKTLLANTIIKNDNPKKKEEPRRAQPQLERDKNRSIFYLCWKTLFKGIISTVGLPGKV